MKNTGPIIIIEDDRDDQEIIKGLFRQLGVENELVSCDDGAEALSLLKVIVEQPLIILCDINMPKMSGFDLLEAIHADPILKVKSVPFIFFSTIARREEVNRAYQMTVQGFFIKESSIEELRRTLKLLYDYWTTCVHPLNLS